MGSTGVKKIWGGGGGGDIVNHLPFIYSASSFCNIGCREQKQLQPSIHHHHNLVRLSILVIKCPDPHSCVSISVHLRSGCWSWWRDHATLAHRLHMHCHVWCKQGDFYIKRVQHVLLYFFYVRSLDLRSTPLTHSRSHKVSCVLCLFTLDRPKTCFVSWVIHKQQHQCCPG